MPFDPSRGASLALLLALAAAAPAAGPSSPLSFTKDVRPLLTTFCIKCHGEKIKRGEVDLAGLRDEASVARQRKLLRRILEQVRSDEMPPAKQAQPTPAQRDLLVRWLTKTLATVDCGDQAQRDP